MQPLLSLIPETQTATNANACIAENQSAVQDSTVGGESSLTKALHGTPRRKRKTATGSVFQKFYKDRHGRPCRTYTWYVKYYDQGKRLEIPTGTEDREEALAFLRDRMAGIPWESPRRNKPICDRVGLGTQQQWRCIYCHKQGVENAGPDGRQWHIDHLYPTSRGGDDRPDNLVLACATCNLKKRSHLLSEELARTLRARA